ncbi:MAG: SDR family NAD(P)-dependent oxidoreductase [Marinifilaceae bacterium]|jgi:NADP-dependent 3-hydroxy acid dehydrogenase YdfG|nr:SDR family NAD(P)-dependent oxidoreductase [Marinifilaceae bacterium]
MNKIALVTGSTSGIGEACARTLAKLGYNLIIVGRREERLLKLKKELEESFNSDIYTIQLDVRNQGNVETAINNLPSNWKNIDLLINNAGLAVGTSDIQEGVVDDWERMIDTNIKGLLYISRSIAPLMIKNQKGHIINISSIAGKEVYPGGNVYCATKHAVEALTKGMRIDMLKHDIKVSSIAPGMVETEFSIVRYKGDTNKADDVYNGLEPLHAEDIASTMEFIVTRPDNVNINDILIMPTAQANARDTKRS